MHRFALEYLQKWKSKPTRKPLIIRGARQVGKSWLARTFAAEHFENIAELNFERDNDLEEMFKSRNPVEIVKLLELRLNVSIQPGGSLLFLDEIQAAPSVLACLRFFHEELPGLHVIAAGSLLEFALENLEYTMPVGRIEYLHLGPMQFEEFLLAAGQKRLFQYLSAFSPEMTIDETLHRQFMGLFRVFLVTGGMPEAVSTYFANGGLLTADEIKHGILATFKEDFGKYGQRVNHKRLQRLFLKLPSLVGAKFKYVHVDPDERAGALSRTLDLLCMARVAYRVFHSASNGVPLGAQVNDRVFKPLWLDVGLMSSALGLNLIDFEQAADVMLINSGAVCEQVVGQHLLYSLPFYQEPELHYWAREKASSAAEVDFVIAVGSKIIPIEVKAGKSGSLKSLHLFIQKKNYDFAIRLNSDRPSLMNAQGKLYDGETVDFRLLSLPLYMLGQIRRLAREA